MAEVINHPSCHCTSWGLDMVPLFTYIHSRIFLIYLWSWDPNKNMSFLLQHLQFLLQPNCDSQMEFQSELREVSAIICHDYRHDALPEKNTSETLAETALPECKWSAKSRRCHLGCGLESSYMEFSRALMVCKGQAVSLADSSEQMSLKENCCANGSLHSY